MPLVLRRETRPVDNALALNNRRRQSTQNRINLALAAWPRTSDRADPSMPFVLQRETRPVDNDTS
jgi:hypothetical protein